MSPGDVYSLTPGILGTCDSGTLCDFKNFADTLKDFERRGLFWIFQMGPKYNH